VAAGCCLARVAAQAVAAHAGSCLPSLEGLAERLCKSLIVQRNRRLCSTPPGSIPSGGLQFPQVAMAEVYSVPPGMLPTAAPFGGAFGLGSAFASASAACARQPLQRSTHWVCRRRWFFACAVRLSLGTAGSPASPPPALSPPPSPPPPVMPPPIRLPRGAAPGGRRRGHACARACMWGDEGMRAMLATRGGLGADGSECGALAG